MLTTFKPRYSLLLLAVCVVAPGMVGCANIQAIPVHRLPPEFRGRPREAMQQISISRLRQDPPVDYKLGPNDVLGIYIENVLGGEGEAPPVHFPEDGDQAPALGFPVPVREDGTLALPYIEPVIVEGMTLAEATDEVKRAYVRSQILKASATNIMVTLMRRREYRVTVIREEGGGKEGVTKRGTGETIDLPAYENDVLHALNETGGLPGLDAKNEIFILRGDFADGVERDRVMAMINACREPCSCPPELPEHPSIVRIPLRYYPDQLPQFTEEDIILGTGDIVYIPTREREIYYTGGTLQGADHEIPRDYDLDVVGAVSLAGGTVGSPGSGVMALGNGGGGSGGYSSRGNAKPPSELIVLRNLECGGQIPIRVDLNRALTDPSQRLLVQPGDTLILRYTIGEEIFNLAVGLVQFNFLYGLGGQGI